MFVYVYSLMFVCIRCVTFISGPEAPIKKQKNIYYDSILYYNIQYNTMQYNTILLIILIYLHMYTNISIRIHGTNIYSNKWLMRLNRMVNDELKGHIGSAPIYPSSSRRKRCISRIKRIVSFPSNFAVMAA